MSILLTMSTLPTMSTLTSMSELPKLQKICKNVKSAPLAHHLKPFLTSFFAFLHCAPQSSSCQCGASAVLIPYLYNGGGNLLLMHCTYYQTTIRAFSEHNIFSISNISNKAAMFLCQIYAATFPDPSKFEFGAQGRFISLNSSKKNVMSWANIVWLP